MTTDARAPVHRLALWLSRVGEATEAAERAMQDCLSPSEAQRLRGIGAPRRRREYLLSRSLMRHALRQTLALPAEDCGLLERRGAAPRPARLGADTHLSLSHSGGYVCFAIASCPVGVDIEIERPGRDYRASAGFFMDEGEQAQLAAAGNRQGEFFYRAWCAKEAWYKALGADQQAHTTLRSIQYTAVRDGYGENRLIEGSGDDFRFAAVVKHAPERVDQAHYLTQVPLRLE